MQCVYKLFVFYTLLIRVFLLNCIILKYRENKIMLISDTNTVLVIIDMQDKLLPAMSESEYLLSNAEKLISGMQTLNLPIIITEQYPKGLGKTNDTIVKLLSKQYTPIEKTTFSCCRNENFKEMLDNFGKRNIVLCGIETHICVLQTALELKEAGYNVVVTEDCVASRNDNDHYMAIQRLTNEGVIISTYESVLMELCGRSDRPEFKAISAIIK